MYIIVGLGNPGAKYVNTRHNIGFDVIDALCSKFDIKLNKTNFNSVFGEGRICGERVVAAKPQTFMNLSGEAVSELKSRYKTENSEIIIIYDDISLPVGKLRVRPKGSAGGHNGIKSVILNLDSDEFPRVKIGIGAPPHPDYDLADYVLGKFGKDEIEALIPVAVRAVGAVEEIITNGCESAMNKFN